MSNRASVLQMALSMAGVSVNIPAAELILRVMAEQESLGEEFSIKDAQRVIKEVSEEFAIGVPMPEAELPMPVNSAYPAPD